MNRAKYRPAPRRGDSDHNLGAARGVEHDPVKLRAVNRDRYELADAR